MQTVPATSWAPDLWPTDGAVSFCRSLLPKGGRKHGVDPRRGVTRSAPAPQTGHLAACGPHPSRGTVERMRRSIGRPGDRPRETCGSCDSALCADSPVLSDQAAPQGRGTTKRPSGTRRAAYWLGGKGRTGEILAPETTKRRRGWGRVGADRRQSSYCARSQDVLCGGAPAGGGTETAASGHESARCGRRHHRWAAAGDLGAMVKPGTGGTGGTDDTRSQQYGADHGPRTGDALAGGATGVGLCADQELAAPTKGEGAVPVWRPDRAREPEPMLGVPGAVSTQPGRRAGQARAGAAAARTADLGEPRCAVQGV